MDVPPIVLRRDCGIPLAVQLADALRGAAAGACCASVTGCPRREPSQPASG